jgi:hypothetical protein
MNIHHQAFSHTWALEANDQVGEGVQFRVSERLVVSLYLWFR